MFSSESFPQRWAWHCKRRQKHDGVAGRLTLFSHIQGLHPASPVYSRLYCFALPPASLSLRQFHESSLQMGITNRKLRGYQRSDSRWVSSSRRLIITTPTTCSCNYQLTGSLKNKHKYLYLGLYSCLNILQNGYFRVVFSVLFFLFLLCEYSLLLLFNAVAVVQLLKIIMLLLFCFTTVLCYHVLVQITC